MNYENPLEVNKEIQDKQEQEKANQLEILNKMRQIQSEIEAKEREKV